MNAQPDFLSQNPVNPVRENVNEFFKEDELQDIDIASYDQVKDIIETAVVEENGEVIKFNPDDLEAPSWGSYGIEDFQHLMPSKDLSDAEHRYDIVHFFLSGNAINFYFHGEKGIAEKEYRGETHHGAPAMFAGLMEAREKFVEPLDGNFWQNRTEKQIENILDLDKGLEMKEERIEILKELGKGLEKYDGSFLNLLEDCEPRPYTNDENGIADLTSKAMPEAFGSDKFDKKKQLNIGMLYGRDNAADNNWFEIEDMDMLTVYADYMVPVKLNEMDLIDAPKNPGKISAETEKEYRLATVKQVDKVAEALDELYDKQIDPFVLDGFFWVNGRDLHMDEEKEYKGHQSETTDY